jgi:hypothetical protein
MTDYYILEPEVPGHFGDETVLDNSTHPPVVHSLSFEFDGWGGDQLVTAFPVYLVTETLAAELGRIGATGYKLAPVTVRTTRQFREFYGKKKLPPFRWFQVTGKQWHDDFFRGPTNRLTASKRVLDIVLATNPTDLDYEPAKRP